MSFTTNFGGGVSYRRFTVELLQIGKLFQNGWIFYENRKYESAD